MNMDKILRIKELVQELHQYSYSYYILNNPIVGDKEFDDKYDELFALEQETGFIMANSPTQKVGFETKSKLNKTKHKTALKSLDKTKDPKDLVKFHKGKNCLFLLKDDGLTNEIIYEDGELVEGSTRGDSIIGEDITHNVLTYKNLPKQIPFKGLLRVSGEAIIKLNDFEKINNSLPIEDQYKTPRNLCAGSVRQLDSKVCSDRNINFLVFGLLEAEGMEFKTKHESFLWLQTLGFEITPYCGVDSTRTEMEELLYIIDMLKDIAEEMRIPIDGLVMTYDDIEYSNSLSETSHHPLHSIAFKFYDEESTTEYLYTDWNTTRTGMITPTGVFKKVVIDGTDVSRASLCNLDIFEELQLGGGDTVPVIKCNLIIPKITDNYTRSNTETIPTKCPHCGGATEERIKEKARFLYCTNEECGAKLSKIINHYCSKPAMNIDGLSSATIETFMDNGIIDSIVDLYTLEAKKEQILKLPKFGVKKYNNLIASIEQSKKCELSNFIYALGIPNVGSTSSKELVAFANLVSSTPREMLDTILSFKEQDLMRMKDCGEVKAKSICDWFTNVDNLRLINELLHVINFEEIKQVEVKEGVFTGKTLYCTGTFAFGKKEEQKKLVEDNGGTFASGYNKSLSYLVIGSLKGSSKQAKAEKDDVKVLTEEEFLTMVGR